MMAEGNDMREEVKVEEEEGYIGEDKGETVICSLIEGDTG